LQGCDLGPTSGGTQLSIENSNIAEEETDVIVNTTTEDMKLQDSPASKALLTKAGSMLQQACDQHTKEGQRLDKGNILVTESFNSKCKKIIHAHVPSRSEAIKSSINHFTFIADTVRRCLKKAESLGMKSISFPAFGYGQGGYLVHEVAEPMLLAFKDFGSEGPKQLQVIRVVILDSKLHKDFFGFFVSFFKLDMTASKKFLSAIKSTWSPKSSHSAWYAQLQNHGQVLPSHLKTHASPLEEIIHFKIYASSEVICTTIAAKLRETMQKKCMTEKMNIPFIGSLIDSDITDIQEIGKRLQVKVSVIPQIQQITIQGEATIVREAIMEIREVIKKVEEAERELKSVEWQSEEDEEIEQYCHADSLKLERARAKKISILSMVVDSIPVVVNLEKMEEENTATGNIRKVTRVLQAPSCKLLCYSCK
jgi:O-acetyl-ADP-ribose deacetylase (regulator of RNase III)